MFDCSHLEDEANWKVVESADTIYSAGFFLTVSVESMIKVGSSIKNGTGTFYGNLLLEP